MENSEVRNGDSSQCVRVAVNIRPLTTPELLLGCTDCISVVPGEPQVLQRKTEEASMATKRLKELLESRKASSCETFGAGNGNGPGIQALMQALEHELEVTVLVHEVRAEYERQLEERAGMAKEVARLKEEADLLRQSRLRCMLRDKEVAYKEKDLEIRDLKEKEVKLSSYVRQLEMQKPELIHQVKSQNSALKKHSMRIATDGVTNLSNGGHNYDLRKLDHQSSFFLLEDMDTSEPEHSDIDENDDEWVVSCSDIDINDEDWALGKRRVRKRNSRTAGHTSVASNLSDNNDSGSLKLDSSGQMPGHFVGKIIARGRPLKVTVKSFA